MGCYQPLLKYDPLPHKDLFLNYFCLINFFKSFIYFYLLTLFFCSSLQLKFLSDVKSTFFKSCPLYWMEYNHWFLCSLLLADSGSWRLLHQKPPLLIVFTKC